MFFIVSSYSKPPVQRMTPLFARMFIAVPPLVGGTQADVEGTYAGYEKALTPSISFVTGSWIKPDAGVPNRIWIPLFWTAASMS